MYYRTEPNKIVEIVNVADWYSGLCIKLCNEEVRLDILVGCRIEEEIIKLSFI